jgi:hypothetical protein
MSGAMLIYPIWLLAGVIFGAGGAWAVFLRGRKDLNALGKIQRRDRWNLMLALMVTVEKREDRQRIVDLMREP